MASGIQLAKNAGFPDPQLAAAIAFGESSGNVNARNGQFRGLFQIGSQTHPEVQDQTAFDDIGAFRAAFRISKGGKDWHEWDAYNNGSYKSYLGYDWSTSALGTLAPVKPGKGVLDSIASGLNSVGLGSGILGPIIGPQTGVTADNAVKGTKKLAGWGESIAALISAITSTGFWLRAGFVLAGALLLFFGVTTVGKQYTGKIK